MKRPKFIHFVLDDKFITDSIKCFENAGLTDNKYFLYQKDDSEFSYIDPNIVKSINKVGISELFQRESMDVLCLHTLFSLPYDIIINIPSHVKVIWYAWGVDLYSVSPPNGPILEIGELCKEETKTLIKQSQLSRFSLSKIPKIINILYKKYFTSSVESDCLLSQVMNRIDYFSGVFDIEYDMLCEQQPTFRAKQITHNYIHPQEFKIEDIDEPILVSGHNILLGNSAAMFVNHADMMIILKNKIIADTRIIAPLSYSGFKPYVDRVIKKGYRLFGNNFQPLIDYLPLDEYTKIMNSCDSLILGQIRQAATCNCLTALWNGLKLYLFEDSMDYKFYKSHGFVVYSLENEFGKDFEYTKEDVMHNRILIEKFYSYRAWKEDLRNCIETLYANN